MITAPTIPTTTSDPANGTLVIQVEGLHKNYGELNTVRGIDFSVLQAIPFSLEDAFIGVVQRAQRKEP